MAGPKTADLDAEKAMGLRWTFMPVYWRKLEPDAPVDTERSLPAAWRELDAFVISAHDRGLNVLMQAPVVGGNAGGPPKWAGRRENGKAAPRDMEALAAFAGKLAERYRPGGTLARRQGWGKQYGVRAWEIDNEPADYLVNWHGQAGDYAEFVTRAAAWIKKADPQAVIVAPSLATGSGKYAWLEQALDGKELHGSPEYRRAAKPYSLGPAADVVSFHLYEGLDSAFTGRDRTLDRSFSEVRERFEKWEKRTPGHPYARKQEYWHTEGSFDFFGVLSKQRRAAWRFQFFTRAFAAGIRKVIVMDPSEPEQTAVRTYVSTLPDPFPMLPADKEVRAVRGKVTAFRHDDRGGSRRRVWVVWAQAGSGDAEAKVPVHGKRVMLRRADGSEEELDAVGGAIRVPLKGDAKMAPPVLVIDG